MLTTDICSTFRRLAFDTWDRLRLSRSVGYQLGEETITDLNVLEIKIRHPHDVHIQTFSKPEESKNGADWEWWFTGPSKGWFGFRVQAKVLKLDKDEYEHLHYKSTRSALYQSDRLIRSALGSSIPLVPLYCLYSHWSKTPHGLSTCGSFGSITEAFGCSLMSAFDVRHLRINGGDRSLNSVMPHAYPWHCLVCCSGYGDGDLPHRAQNFWKGAIRPNELPRWTGSAGQGGLEGEEIDQLVAVYERLSVAMEPPTHVSQLFSGELSQAPDQNLGGIIVVREVE